MITSDFIQNVNDALRALDDDTPLDGTDEWNYWLRVANRKKNELYRDTTKLWGSSYQVANLGTISAASEPSFDLEDEFLFPANKAYVITTSDSRTDITIIKPQEKSFSNQEVFIAGQNPQTLYFTKEILSDDTIVGGTLYLPGYYMPDDIVNAGDEIQIEDPYWLVMATASEIAFSDLTYEDKASDLNAKANALYTQMIKMNRMGTYGNPRVSPHSVFKIPDTRRQG